MGDRIGAVLGAGRRRATSGLAVAALLAGGLTACSDGDDASSDGEPGPDGAFSVAAAVDSLPAQEADELLISVADVAAVSAANGLDRPGSVEEASADWMLVMTGGSEAVAMLSPPATVQNLDQAEFAATTGFSWVQADWFASVSAPPDDFTVYAGEPGQVDFPETVTELGDGIHTVGEGEDHEMELGGGSGADRMGRPLRLAQARDVLAASLSTPTLERWLEPEETTLGEDESISAVAEALDDADAVSAVLATLPDPAPATVGVGWSEGDDGTVVTVAYDLGSGDAAQDAAGEAEEAFAEGVSAVTRQPYSELVQLEAVDVAGQVVVVTLAVEPDRVSTPLQMLTQRDLPLLG